MDLCRESGILASVAAFRLREVEEHTIDLEHHRAYELTALVDVHWLASCRRYVRICITGPLSVCLFGVARIHGILSVAIGASVDQNLEDGRMELARQDCIRAHS